MKRKLALLISIVFCFVSIETLSADSNVGLSITGLVKQPLNLTVVDLMGFDSIKVQLNEVMQDRSFRGNFVYRGVPLKALLELACIGKEQTAFNKKTDLAIRITGENGRQVALSWGEIFYKNGGEKYCACRMIILF